MENWKSVCAVIDMQGFLVDIRFYPRELVILNDTKNLYFNIDSELDIKDIKNQKLINDLTFQKHLIHGIPIKSEDKWNILTLKADKIRELLPYMYQKIKTQDKVYFACKNQQVSKILKDLKIPFVDLEHTVIGGEICPSLKKFDIQLSNKDLYFCKLHTCLTDANSPFFRNLRCSSRKCSHIWKWLNNKIIVEKIFEGFNNLEL